MKTVQKLKYLVAFYMGLLVVLLLAVIAIPLTVQQEISVTSTLIIEEEFIETALIVILFVISCLILRTFNRTVYSYEQAANRSSEERSKMISQIKDAFNYIGTVNVELHEIESIFCQLEHYPKTINELNLVIDNLAMKALTVARTPWIVIRIINRCSGNTLTEHQAVRPNKMVPTVTMGNKKVIENQMVAGLMKLNGSQRNLDLMTVAILPEIKLSKVERLLITAIINQIEIHYLLYHSGFLDHHLLSHQGITSISTRECHNEKVDLNAFN